MDEWGRTVVMVTHDARMAAYADRIVFLKDGTVVDDTRLRRPGSQQTSRGRADGNAATGDGNAAKSLAGAAARAERSTTMNTYITLPVRYLWGRKTRTVLTTLAIVFGVAVIFGVNILLPSLLNVLNAGVVGATGQAQISINSAGGEAFDAGVLDAVRQTSGVAAASPVFRREIVLPGTTADATDRRRRWTQPPRQQVRSYQVASGRFLAAADTARGRADERPGPGAELAARRHLAPADAGRPGRSAGRGRGAAARRERRDDAARHRAGPLTPPGAHQRD